MHKENNNKLFDTLYNLYEIDLFSLIFSEKSASTFGFDNTCGKLKIAILYIKPSW